MDNTFNENESESDTSLLYTGETIYRRLPKNLKPEDNHLFSNEYTCMLEDCYSHRYHNAIINSRGLAVYYEKEFFRGMPHIIPQCITQKKVSMKIIMKIILQYMGSMHTNEIETGILFTDINAHGYFHWLTEALPRLLSCEQLYRNDCIIIIPDKFYTSFAKESMQLLGIDEKQIYILPANTILKVKSLWSMDHPARPVGAGNYRPSLIQHLQLNIEKHLSLEKGELESIAKKYSKKIYISRNDTKYRHMINEEEIISIMQKNGFSIICASEMSLREQIILFSQAEILISIHGAGLSNMIWMPKQSKIAEIRLQNDEHNNCYFSLASALDIAYYYSIATSEDEDIHKADILWDKADALRLLEEIYE